MIKYMNLIGINARKTSEYKITTKVKNKILVDYAAPVEFDQPLFVINPS